jgi:hypothetical protein
VSNKEKNLKVRRLELAEVVATRENRNEKLTEPNN